MDKEQHLKQILRKLEDSRWKVKCIPTEYLNSKAGDLWTFIFTSSRMGYANSYAIFEKDYLEMSEQKKLDYVIKIYRDQTRFHLDMEESENEV